MKSFWKRRRSQKGFSLLEVIIATAILGVAGVALLLGLTSGVLGSQRVSQKRAALDVAQSQMEFVKSQTFDNSSTDGDGIGVYQTLDTSQLPKGFTQANIVLPQATKTDGNPLALDGSDRVQLITVTVTYNGGKKSVTLSGYKGND
jgi:prepilin-type N-terminal cleavage/methylation domain-containing protein